MKNGGHPADAFSVHPIPTGADPFVEAGRLRGIVAIGWYFEDGFTRPMKRLVNDGIAAMPPPSASAGGPNE